MTKPRMKVGCRSHVARFSRHNGTADEFGNPTYSVDNDWIKLPVSWPCEMLTTTGGETVRGRQVTEVTTHILFGESFGCDGVKPEHRCEMQTGELFAVVSVTDPDGLSREKRVELRREN